MRILKLTSQVLIVLLLVGCNSSQEIAYWTDSSYKTVLDYDAEQQKILNNDISSVHSAISDLLNGSLGELKVDESLGDMSTPTPDDNTIVLENADKTQTASYLRKHLKQNGRNITNQYYCLSFNNNQGSYATGENSGVYTDPTTNKKYINIVSLAMRDTVSDAQFSNYLSSFIENICPNNTVTYTYKQLMNKLDYTSKNLCVTAESLGLTN